MHSTNTRLINDEFAPKFNSTYEKYKYFKQEYEKGHTYILLNNVRIFGPFPKPAVPWDISEEEKIAIYNPEVTKVLTWIKTRIVINLASIDYKTVDVLIRIATGMLEKTHIPKETKILFHDNMVENLRQKQTEIILSSLPF